jgi:large conductance mechanosensitive channel
MIKEFKEFIAGGNMLEFAIAVILAGAIGGVITAFVEKVMMPIVAAIVGKPSFDEVGFTIKDSFVGIGFVITALINLILVGAVLFAIVKAYRKMKEAEAAAASGPSEVDLLTEIRDSLKARN